MFLVVESSRLRVPKVDYGLISLWGRTLNEAEMREWAHHSYGCPVDMVGPELVALLAKYGWVVLTQLDPGPAYVPGIRFTI